jgi:outer membrane protein assembly factor BamB
MIRRFLQAVSIVLLAGFTAVAGDWPRFRGPNGAGLSDSVIPAEWTDANRLWKIALPGSGHGSPVVWQDRVFLLCGDESTGRRTALCVSAKDGATLWKHDAPGSAYHHHRFNSVASSTPAVDTERVYFTWGSPEKITVAAFRHDGTPVWEADLGPVKRDHGYGNSPIIHDGLVILSNDQESDCALIALDAATGKVRWSLPRTENHSNYATPCIYQPAGATAQVIVSSWRLGLTGVEAATGRQLWQKPVYGTRQERAIASPFIAEDFVIGNCGFAGRDKHVVVLRPGKGADMEEAWRVEKSAPHIPSPIVVKDRMFLWNDQGVITCVKLATGEPVWSERVPGEFFASPVCAAGRLFGVDKTGVVTVVAVADKFQLLARNSLEEASQATPAIADGRMFIRTLEHLHCIGARIPQQAN